MHHSTKKHRRRVALFGSVQGLCFAAILAAMSLILGKFLQIPNPFQEFIRISFENLPVMLAGIAMGPVVGALVGTVADLLGCFLMERYSAYLNGKPNRCGGVYRAGTGSAMDYISKGAKVGATADGRRAKAPFASSYSPSPEARLKGPLSNILSFTKFDLRKICNGGPFTIEIHDTVFRNDEGERKVAQLVKTYIDRGGHQIQINAINRDRLLDAQAHPENYPNLIVRVWGWSGYFTELDTVYQNHVIDRMEFTV